MKASPPFIPPWIISLLSFQDGDAYEPLIPSLKITYPKLNHSYTAKGRFKEDHFQPRWGDMKGFSSFLTQDSADGYHSLKELLRSIPATPSREMA